MTETNPLEAQLDLYQRTLADEFLANVAILRQSKEDIASEIEQSLSTFNARGGKMGACIICQEPMGGVGDVQVAGGVMDWEFTFLVLENPMVNDGSDGTGLKALTIARRLFGIHYLYHPHGLASALVGRPPRAIVPLPGNKLSPVVWEVALIGSEEEFAPDIKVATPVIAVTGSDFPHEVTLSCATAGAGIYYTVDGSHPWSGNAEAELYTAPFDVIEPGVLRVGAFKSGLIASDVSAQRFIES